MKKIYLHIGTHRTGSSSIQYFLAQAQGGLAKQGILYPETGRPDTDWSNQYGHHLLHWSLIGKQEVDNDQLWLNLQMEIKRSEANRIVLSAEGFEWEGKDKETQIQRVGEYLEPHPIHVILYLRPPLRFLESAYKKRVEMGNSWRPFSQFVEKMIPRCDYGTLVSRWENAECIQSLDIRLYEKVKLNPGLEADFSDAIGASFQELRSFVGDPVNTSPPDACVQVARWINLIGRAGSGSTWRTLVHRARRNVLGGRTPGKYLVDLWAPFMRERIVTEQAASVLRRSLGEKHRQFLEEYLPEEDWEHLRLTGKSKRPDLGAVA